MTPQVPPHSTVNPAAKGRRWQQDERLSAVLTRQPPAPGSGGTAAAGALEEAASLSGSFLGGGHRGLRSGERATMGTENLGEKMPHFGLGITEDAEGGKDPASEECVAKFGGPLGPLKT